MRKGSMHGFGVAGALVGSIAAGPQGQWKLLYPGSLDPPELEAPVAGVLLTDPPAIYHRGSAGQPPAGGRWEQVPPDRDVRLSRDGLQVLFFRYADGDTELQRPPGPEASVTGEVSFVLDARAQTVVAFDKEPDERGERHVSSLRGTESLAKLTVRGLRWVSVSDDGSRFAIGTDTSVQVLERAGVAVVPELHVASATGSLSPTGMWLGLVTAEAAGTRLTWIPLRTPAPPARSFDVAAGGRLAFSAARDLTAHVASREVIVFHLDDGGPQPVLRRPAPAGFAWRSAAFDAQGRLALGRIRVERRPYRDPSDQVDPFRKGAASVAVDFFETLPGEPVASTEWSVPLWNGAAPELGFTAGGRCIASTGYSVFDVETPWTH